MLIHSSYLVNQENTCIKRVGAMKKTTFLKMVLIHLFLVFSSAQASQLAKLNETHCYEMVSLSIPDVKITEAKLVSDGLEYCDITGSVKTRMGFKILLPTNWNGNMYFGGNGGFAGEIADTSHGLERGYATVSTDTGHQASAFDASWALKNRTAEIDYGYRAVHQVTLVSKEIITSYYGRAPKFSYFDGCSNGGRQALMEAQKYPSDFNGIAAGAPALDWTDFMIGANWNMHALEATETSSLIPYDKYEAIENAVLQECDANDGLVDGLIDDPRNCNFRPESLLCKGAENADCLSQPQVEALKKIISGPKDAAGHHIYPGFPAGGMTSDFLWVIWLSSVPDVPFFQYLFQDQFFRYMAFNNDDPNYDWHAFNIDKDSKRLTYMGSILNATNTDLRNFHDSGGKLLMYQGWSDPAISPMRVIQYYKEVRKRLATQNPEATLRLFMAPGMCHCSGGPGPNDFDYLSALEKWVEQGKVPESIEARHYNANGKIDRTRPLCAFPKVARYNGSGSINKAANFTCVSL